MAPSGVSSRQQLLRDGYTLLSQPGDLTGLGGRGDTSDGRSTRRDVKLGNVVRDSSGKVVEVEGLRLHLSSSATTGYKGVGDRGSHRDCKGGRPFKAQAACGHIRPLGYFATRRYATRAGPSTAATRFDEIRARTRTRCGYCYPRGERRGRGPAAEAEAEAEAGGTTESSGSHK